MAKLKSDSITSADLIDFLDNQSDFGFEIKVLRMLTDEGFECEHGGTYQDPVTDKPRQFDIRATKRFGRRIIRLAVECKNLKDCYPLLTSCLPRTDEESFHEVIHSTPQSQMSLSGFDIDIPIPAPGAEVIPITGKSSFYRPNELVGKSIDQVGRAQNDVFVSGDSEVYAKWAQAMSSAQDLVDRAYYESEEGDGGSYFSVVIPVLAVPDGTLWQVSFDEHGLRVGEPNQVERCPYFVNISYFAGERMHEVQYHISHLEFATLSGLCSLVREWTKGGDGLKILFPEDELI